MVIMKQKKQHYVPRTYLKSWCDPNRPPKQVPYVWLHSLDGQTIRKKSPDNIFTESNFYTIKGINGSRDLVLENGLSELENLFARARRNMLSKGDSLDVDDRFALCAFTAVMQARTKGQRDHWRGNWQRAADMMEKIMDWSAQATPEEQDNMAKTLNTPGYDADDGISYDEVKATIEQPMLALLTTAVDVVLPILMSMQLVILETSKPQFITSDSPCCWYDPAMTKEDSRIKSAAIGSPTIEISLPVSPHQLLYFTHYKVLSDKTYLNIDSENSVIEGFNIRTALYAKEFLVSKTSKPLGIYMKPK